MGFEIEVTGVPSIRSTGVMPYPLYDFMPNIWPIPFVRQDRRALFFLTNFRLEIPAGVNRARPFVVGGGGVASITERTRFAYDDVVPLLSPDQVGSFPGSIGEIFSFGQAEVGLVLNLGGGVDFTLTKGLMLEIDLRYYRISGPSSVNIGRFGAGVAFRF